jgi:hypothetical protein
MLATEIEVFACACALFLFFVSTPERKNAREGQNKRAQSLDLSHGGSR